MGDHAPDVSIVMPCFNEESAIQTTAPELVDVFAGGGVRLELVLVNNGSADSTGPVIDGLIAEGRPIKKVSFEKNQGYGGGILAGLAACRAPVVGFLCADGQVSARDALMAHRLIEGRENRCLVKVRRKFRRDSWRRKIISIIYNGLMQILFGWLGAIDINGSPKLFSRETLEKLDLTSRDWFLDPEIMIKARHLGLKIIEVDVEGRARRGGASSVNLAACLEFLKNIAIWRVGGPLKAWRRGLRVARETGAPRGAAPAAGARGERGERGESGFDRVRILPQNRFEDSRGFLQKVLQASRGGGAPRQGEVYVAAARPGESRGGHYHLNMGEWFSVIQGRAALTLGDRASGETRTIALEASTPQTIYAPPGVAHAVSNTGEELMICVAWAEKEHDPGDVHPYEFDFLK
ncbi:MAG: glycosyltransferase [Desulfobacterales bacterium]|nr:glycosyltransferase [Desulfobacterales bacterium]